ncbi:MAG: T9SS C-terminal target domain-containing protein [Ignavibacteriales bacterium]|nr:MAG: T9SS C-terminal target domain-containing protein [Ignavibacteriales bacterium]
MTKYNIQEISDDTVKVIKQLQPSLEFFKYYPLAVGNKWLYYGEYNNWIHPRQFRVQREITDFVKKNNGNTYFEITESSDIEEFQNIYYERVDSATCNIFRYNADSVNSNSEYIIDDPTIDLGDTVKSFRFPDRDNYTLPVFISDSDTNLFNQSSHLINFIYGKITTWSYSLAKNFGIKYVASGNDTRFYNCSLIGALINGVIYGDSSVVSVNEDKNSAITFSLAQNFPNPFNPTTKIKYTIPIGTRHSAAGGSSLQNVQLKVYDILGNEVATLVNEEKPAGEYEVELDGSKLSSGIYFYVLNFGNQRLSKKMCLIK